MFLLFRKKRIGLVLGGGGVRGFFHMGVIKALQELNITISEISGTSIGGLVGAIYAANPQVNFEEIADDLNFFKITQMIASHLDKNVFSKLENELKKYIPVQSFSEFKIPISFNAVDLNNSQEIVFDRGSVFPEIISAISIPGVLPPIEHQDRFLLDGGILNNIPINHLKNSDKIIVSDVSGPIKTVDKQSKGPDIFYSAIALMQRNISLNNPETQKMIKKYNPLFLTLNDDQTFILDFRKKNFQTLIDLGYQTTMANRDQILALK